MGRKKTDNNTGPLIQQVMFDVVAVLNSYGIVNVSAGHLMRLIGTDSKLADEWNDALLVIVDDKLELIPTDSDGGSIIH